MFNTKLLIHLNLKTYWNKKGVQVLFSKHVYFSVFFNYFQNFHALLASCHVTILTMSILANPQNWQCVKKKKSDAKFISVIYYWQDFHNYYKNVLHFFACNSKLNAVFMFDYLFTLHEKLSEIGNLDLPIVEQNVIPRYISFDGLTSKTCEKTSIISHLQLNL